MATSIGDFCANGFLVVRGAIAPDIAPAPTHDDLLVFYLPGADDWHSAVTRLKELGHQPVKAFNPYWDKQGQTFADPDGCRGVLRAGPHRVRRQACLWA